MKNNVPQKLFLRKKEVGLKKNVFFPSNLLKRIYKIDKKRNENIDLRSYNQLNTSILLCNFF